MADSPRSPADPAISKKSRLWVLAALVAYWCLIFTLTHIPVPMTNLPKNSDKLAHILMYGGLAFLLAWSLHLAGRRGRSLVVAVILIAATYGIADELLQIPVGRKADVMDWLADCGGAVVGLVWYWMTVVVLERWLARR